ncbi:MAG: vitamin B12-dependent ribonucleotide reductase, partial [Verrucomicrobia bacterium]|nr:vitamin B12-dependent ribonucleotide reductase [Verrucomicrobiota bacterium]
GALTSMALQYGVPLESLVKKFAYQRFEPSGFTKNPDIRQATSITDYVFRWLACQFIPGYRESTSPNKGQQELSIPGLEEEMKKTVNRPVSDLPPTDDAKLATLRTAVVGQRTKVELTLTNSTFVNQADAPACPNCGHVTVRNGACYKCNHCGESLGCS